MIDLLDLSKLESGKMEMDFTSANLEVEMKTSVEEQAARLKEYNLSILYNVKISSTKACFDDVRISQVITNFLSNAIKFSPQGGDIEFTISESEIAVKSLNNKSTDEQIPALFFSVRDHGEGIVKGEFELVFDKFEQGSLSEVGTTKGTGLGLPISKEIIELHHGKIWAENHPQGGAVFCFEIPTYQSINQ